MHKILIAPDSFKGTLGAREVCDILGRAFSAVFSDAEITSLPLSDGGEGLCSCIFEAVGGKFKKAVVTGVHGDSIEAEYLLLPDMTAVIESAVCCGLPLAGESNDPAASLTVGVGELMLNATSSGAERILLGLGGSATNDCGIGLASVLGYGFFDKYGRALEPCGRNLISIAKIVKPKKEFGIPVIAACDVTNPLYGKNGAARVFASQKGADSETVELLDRGAENFAEAVKHNLNIDIAFLPGAGAAGGMGAGAVIFAGATLKKGIDIIFDACGFENKIKNADLAITGEGRLDYQSFDGKVISGVAAAASKYGKKLIAICGYAGDGADRAGDFGISKVFCCINGSKPMNEIIKTCKTDLYNAGLAAAQEIYRSIDF